MWFFNRFHKVMSKLDNIENLIFGLKKEINTISSEMQALTDSSDAMVATVSTTINAINVLIQEVADLTAHQSNPEDVAQMVKLTADLNSARDALVTALPVPPEPVEPPVG
jgi:uncharacterized protein YoxC